MLRALSACIAVIAGFAASSALAQSYPPDDEYRGGGYGAAPSLILPDGYGPPEGSHDSYDSSEAPPADADAPDGAPAGDDTGDGYDGGH